MSENFCSLQECYLDIEYKVLFVDKKTCLVILKNVYTTVSRVYCNIL